jgi:hypothetical protein
MLKALSIAIALMAFSVEIFAAKFQYFVFPLTDIVGLEQKPQDQTAENKKPNYGPLISTEALDLVMPLAVSSQRRQGQDELIAHFIGQVRKTYPEAAVHPKQISTSIQGTHAYVDMQDCSAAGFRAPIKDAYAVSLGLTRLNVFAARSDRYVQIFIPVTLNIQFVRPNGLQSVFTKSHTEYFGRELTLAEAYGPDRNFNTATTKMLRDGAMAAAKRAVDALLLSAKTGFQPKQSEVEVLDWSGKYVVLNRGSEVGFVSGQPYDVEGGDYFFKILRTQRGWSVGEFSGPSPKLQKGLRLSFEIPSPIGKDDDKPDLMPVVYGNKTGFNTIGTADVRTSIADYFSYDVGFDAKFNVVSLNSTLDEIGTGIKSDANCGGMNKQYETMPGLGNVSSAKRATPHYFVVFDTHSSMPLRTSFTGTVGEVTRDTYRVVATARIFDRNSTVFQAAIADKSVENEVAFGKGISPEQVKNSALKDVAFKLTQSLVGSLKFTPRDYTITSVEPGRIKLSNAARANVRNGNVLRPLNIKVAGSTVMIPFDPSDVGVDAEPQVQIEGNDLWVKVNDPKRTLRSGDVFRTTDLVENRELIRSCNKAVFEIPNNAIKIKSSNLAALTVANSIVNSSKYNLIEPDAVSIELTNQQLQQGLFTDTIQLRNDATQCFVPAIWVREESSQCEKTGKCSSTGSIGAGIIVERDGQMLKRDMVNLRITVQELEASKKIEFYDIKAFEALRATTGDLSKKISSF